LRRLYELLPVHITLCVLACGLLGNGLYYTIADFSKGIPARVLAIRLGFLALLLLCGGLLYKRQAEKYGAPAKLWLGTFVAVVLAGAGADSWQAWLEELAGRGPVQWPVGSILYFLFVLIVFAWVNRVFQQIPPRSLVENVKPELRAHLILFLSDIDLKAYPAGVPDWLNGNERDLKTDLKRLADEKRNRQGADNGSPRWPWEQPLRAVDHHLQENTLRSVTIIASKESIRRAPLFANLVAAYPALKTVNFKLFLKAEDQQLPFCDLQTPVPPCGGFSFQNFTDLSRGLNKLLKLLLRDLHESDIMIDFTSGQKVTSVVAAAMTFNRLIRAQYVQTEDPWDVLSYIVVTPQRPI